MVSDSVSQRDCREIVEGIRNAKPGVLTIAAHRALRWNGIPDNVSFGLSCPAVLEAARAGLPCVELDIQLTSDRVPIVFHDDGLGRSTDIGERLGQQVYSPYTGKGYNPLVRESSWAHTVQHLHLKEEHGMVTSERVQTLASMLDYIREACLEVVVLLDLKTSEAEAGCFKVLRTKMNWRGIPAMEWCIFKTDACWYPDPEVLEHEEWFKASQSEGFTPLMMPVLRPNTAGDYNPLACVKGYASKSYTIAFEVGLRSPGSILQDVANFIASSECPVRSLAFYAPLGDIHPRDDIPIQYDLGDFDLDSNRTGLYNPWAFSDNCPPRTFDSVLARDDSITGQDQRWDLELYKGMGYNMVIADHGDVLSKHFSQIAGSREGSDGSAIFLEKGRDTVF